MDVKLVRENPDAVVASLKRRGADDKVPLVSEAAEADSDWRRCKTEVDRLRHRQNELTAQVAALKKKGEPIEDKLKEVKDIPQKIKDLEGKSEEASAKLTSALMGIPNILHESVPPGKDESESVTIRTWGKHPEFGFEPKDHIDLLTALEMVDMERGAKVAGARFFFLKGEAVKLEHAIMQFALDFLRKKGYTAVEPPFMLNRESYEGVVNLEDFGPVIYKIEGEVLLDVTFGADGTLRVHHVDRGLGHGLDEAAIRAAQQIRFRPARRDGQPFDTVAVLHIVFELAY